MSILPPQTPLQALLYDPVGSFIMLMLSIMCLIMLIRFAFEYPTMKLQIDLANICIGGAC